jgi:ABC-type transport system substrate-binding protein
MFGSFIKLEATDKHWRIGVPKYKYMTYLIIPEESTRMAMLKTGEADIARISRGTVKEAQSAGLNIVTKENEAVVYLMPTMQWAVPAFGDIRFRKALNLAIDREAIIKHIFFGMAKNVALWPGSSSSAFGGDPTLKPYPYAPQEAARLVKEGGWEGYEFNIPSYLRAGYPEELQVKEAIVGYWEKIGLKPKIVMTDFAAFRRLMIERKTLNYVHGGEDATSPDVPMLLPKFMDRWYFKNPRARVNIPELNERFERIGKSLDPAEVSRLLAEVYKYAYDQYSQITICEIPGKIATTKRIPAWDLGHRHQDRNYYDLIQQR